MPVPIFFILFCIGGAITLVCHLIASEADSKIKYLVPIPYLALWIWFILSATQPIQIKETIEIPWNTITTSTGTQIQIDQVGTKLPFNVFLPPNAKVYKTTYQRMYLGVDWLYPDYCYYTINNTKN